MIPQSFYDILRSVDQRGRERFPPTEVYNEGWMLRLLVGALTANVRAAGLIGLPEGSRWFSEALLDSPFSPRRFRDPLGEGATNADAVIGHFAIRPGTRAGIALDPGARQFVVLEAKMFSNLASGTTRAGNYSQASRNVACMAWALDRTGIDAESLSDVGFYVLAPEEKRRGRKDSNLEAAVDVDRILEEVTARIARYEAAGRQNEFESLRGWHARSFQPLLRVLKGRQCLRVVTWEEAIESIRRPEIASADELGAFYARCLEYAPKFARH